MDDVWSTPFSPEMLEICPNLIIACPREEIAFELMEILEDHHVKWASIEAPTNKTRWGDNREETVYFVEDRRLTFCYMNYVNQTSAYDSYTKCTFYGRDYCGDNTKIEPVSQEEILGLLGI